jgi:hypothetical protein
MKNKIKDAYLSIPERKRWRVWAGLVVAATTAFGLTAEATDVVPFIEIISPVVLSFF